MWAGGRVGRSRRVGSRKERYQTGRCDGSPLERVLVTRADASYVQAKSDAGWDRHVKEIWFQPVARDLVGVGVGVRHRPHQRLLRLELTGGSIQARFAPCWCCRCCCTSSRALAIGSECYATAAPLAPFGGGVMWAPLLISWRRAPRSIMQ